MLDSRLPRSYIHVPPSLPEATRIRKLLRLMIGAVLTPLYGVLAWWRGAPGLTFHLRCAALGVRMALFGRRLVSLGWAYQYMFYPLDSTRYFEFDAIWKFAGAAPIGRYLDISSPRQFTFALLKQRSGLHAVMLNPDRKDLALTANLAAGSGLADRCRFICSTIADAPLPRATFDTITCISVLEHIPDDIEAVRRMWGLLRPGGRLFISVPCAARGLTQYIDYNEYDLLAPDEKGFVFWQRFYDANLLEERVFRQIGPPKHRTVYGEKVAGSFQRNAERKRAEYGATYPFWRESYMMATEYAYFQSLDDLPGEGVIAMEFEKA